MGQKWYGKRDILSAVSMALNVRLIGRLRRSFLIRAFAWRLKDVALILQAIGLTANIENMNMVQQSVQCGSGQHLIAAENFTPIQKRLV